jgi:hypothetical protein
LEGREGRKGIFSAAVEVADAVGAGEASAGAGCVGAASHTKADDPCSATHSGRPGAEVMGLPDRQSIRERE